MDGRGFRILGQGSQSPQNSSCLIWMVNKNQFTCLAWDSKSCSSVDQQPTAGSNSSVKKTNCPEYWRLKTCPRPRDVSHNDDDDEDNDYYWVKPWRCSFVWRRQQIVFTRTVLELRICHVTYWLISRTGFQVNLNWKATENDHLNWSSFYSLY